MTLRSQVQAFHALIDKADPLVPQVPSPDRVRLRARLITEEHFETMRALLGPSACLSEAEGYVALAIKSSDGDRVDLVAFADGCADLAYVVEGSLLECGIDSGPVFDEVHRTNMAKRGGGKDANGKARKPEGWTPPRLDIVLLKQGWKP